MLAENMAKRIVSIGGSVTEIIYALDEQKRLIARDSTSLYPPSVTALPDVGYIRRLSPEGVLSVNPELIITLEGAGPPEAIDVLEAANVKFAKIPESYDGAGILNKIEAVGLALNKVGAASKLSSKVAADLAKLKKITDTITTRKKVLFVLSTQGGKILASGTNSAAAGVIALAGADNAIEEFAGYKTLTDEAIITAAPDVILMMDRRGDHSSGNDELFSHPAIALTPAATQKNIIRMDGLYLLGFGPRTASAAKDLAVKIYGNSIKVN